MRTILSLVLILALADLYPALAQDNTADIAQLKANNVMIQATLTRIVDMQSAQSAIQARQQSDIADLQVNLKAANDKLDAILKAQGGTLRTTQAWDVQAFAFTPGSPQPTQPMYLMQSGYGSAAMGAGARLLLFPNLLPRLRGGGLLGGKCGAGG